MAQLKRIPRWEKWSRLGRGGAKTGTTPQKVGGFNPLKSLGELEPGQLLTGKDLTGAARALTALQLRPELHGYKQLANQLGQAKRQEASGLGKLGTRLTGEVGSAYSSLGASQAQDAASQAALAANLNTTAAGIASQGAQQLTQMQTGQLGDVQKALELRGAPAGGSAQSELSALASQQQAAQNADSQASQQFAAQQGASYGQLQAALSGASQLQGADATRGIARETGNRIGKSNQEYNQNIQTALGKWADAKASKGPLMAKNFLELRGNEQKYELGKQAVAGEKAKLGLEGEKLTAEQEQNATENAINQEKAQASLNSAAASAKNAAVAAYKAHHPYASSGEKAKREKEVQQETAEIKSLIGPIVSKLGKPPANVPNSKVLNAYINEVNAKASADPTLVAKLVRGWFAKKQLKDAVTGGW